MISGWNSSSLMDQNISNERREILEHALVGLEIMCRQITRKKHVRSSIQARRNDRFGVPENMDK